MSSNSGDVVSGDSLLVSGEPTIDQQIEGSLVQQISSMSTSSSSTVVESSSSSSSSAQQQVQEQQIFSQVSSSTSATVTESVQSFVTSEVSPVGVGVGIDKKWSMVWERDFFSSKT